MAKLVSKVYGDALFEESIEKQSVDTLFSEVKALLAIWRENPELAELLDNLQSWKSLMLVQSFR